jgi:DNA invertase Pin-like site-specific DNA recombinase
MRAAIYARVSSAEQVEGTSLDGQRRECAAEVERRGWALHDEYVDEGVSGALESRPQLDRLLADVQTGVVQAVVVAKTDRLARDELVRLLIMRELRKAGALFVALDQHGVDHTTDEGSLMASVLGAFSEFERKRIAARTRAGLALRVQAGGWSGGNVAPYGYRIVGAGREAHLEVDEAEATMVRLAVELCVDHGLTSGEAAARLNALGYTPRNAALWTSQNLRNMLNRGQFDGVWTFAKPAKRVKAEPITIQVEPVIPAERMAALRAHLKATSLHRGAPSAHPLSGRLFCPCGAHMTGIARGDRANRRYRCRYGRHEPGRPFCGLPSLLADPADNAVWAQVLALLSDPAALAAAAREHLGLLDTAARAEVDALGEAETAVERTQRALADGAARCLSLELDEPTTQRTVAELQQRYQAAVRHRAMVLASGSRRPSRSTGWRRCTSWPPSRGSGWYTRTGRCRRRCTRCSTCG